jgi:hypothetical protein
MVARSTSPFTPTWGRTSGAFRAANCDDIISVGWTDRPDQSAIDLSSDCATAWGVTLTRAAGSA